MPPLVLVPPDPVPFVPVPVAVPPKLPVFPLVPLIVWLPGPLLFNGCAPPKRKEGLVVGKLGLLVG
jgi:hypothetical protein